MAYDPKISTHISMYEAAFYNRIDELEYYLQSGADPNGVSDTTRTTPLMGACLRGNIDSVEILLKYGADPLLKSTAGRSALHIAHVHGFEDIVSLLEKHV